MSILFFIFHFYWFFCRLFGLLSKILNKKWIGVFLKDVPCWSFNCLNFFLNFSNCWLGRKKVTRNLALRFAKQKSYIDFFKAFQLIFKLQEFESKNRDWLIILHYTIQTPNIYWNWLSSGFDTHLTVKFGCGCVEDSHKWP